MSRSLIKILDAAIFPAALMISGKFIGLYLVTKIFNIDWGVENLSNQLISSRPVVYGQDLVTVSSYSDLFLLIIMTSGFSVFIIRAIYFHESHIDPRLLTRLAMKGLLGLVKDSFEIYHRASMWLIFLWLSDVTIFINVVLGKTYSWVFLAGLAFSVLLTVMLLRDVSYELRIAHKRLYK